MVLVPTEMIMYTKVKIPPPSPPSKNTQLEDDATQADFKPRFLIHVARDKFWRNFAAATVGNGMSHETILTQYAKFGQQCC